MFHLYCTCIHMCSPLWSCTVLAAFAQQYECICFEAYMAGCIFPLHELFMKLPLAYTIPKPSIAKSALHIVIVLSLCVDGGYVIVSPLRVLRSPWWHTVGTFQCCVSNCHYFGGSPCSWWQVGTSVLCTCSLQTILLALALYSLVKKKKLNIGPACFLCWLPGSGLSL